MRYIDTLTKVKANGVEIEYELIEAVKTLRELMMLTETNSAGNESILVLVDNGEQRKKVLDHYRALLGDVLIKTGCKSTIATFSLNRKVEIVVLNDFKPNPNGDFNYGKFYEVIRGKRYSMIINNSFLTTLPDWLDRQI